MESADDKKCNQCGDVPLYVCCWSKVVNGKLTSWYTCLDMDINGQACIRWMRFEYDYLADGDDC
jgi:hypothetical protein